MRRAHSANARGRGAAPRWLPGPISTRLGWIMHSIMHSAGKSAWQRQRHLKWSRPPPQHASQQTQSWAERCSHCLAQARSARFAHSRTSAVWTPQGGSAISTTGGPCEAQPFVDFVDCALITRMRMPAASRQTWTATPGQATRRGEPRLPAQPVRRGQQPSTPPPGAGSSTRTPGRGCEACRRTARRRRVTWWLRISIGRTCQVSGWTPSTPTWSSSRQRCGT
jgi:hypothetical protein